MHSMFVKSWLSLVALLGVSLTIGCEGLPPTSGPGVISTSPADGAAAVSPDASIIITFAKPADPESIGGDIEPSVDFDLRWSADNRIVTVTPTASLEAGTTYTVTITELSFADGSALATPFSFSFTISAVPDDGDTGTYYVACDEAGASDDNDGLSPTFEGGTRGPWETISHATASMRAGDMTYVLGGTYREDNIRFSNSGTADAPIVLSAFESDEVIIDGSNGESDGGIIVAPEVSHVSIEGLTIRNVTGYGIIAGSEDNARRSEGIVIRDVRVSAYGGGNEGTSDGIILSNVDSFNLDNLETHQGGNNGVTLASCTNGTVTNSTFHDNPGHAGLEIQQGHDITVSNCTAYNNRVYGFDVSLWPKTPPFAYNIIVEECLAYDNLNSGFSVNSLAHDIVFRRNIAWRNGFDPEGLIGGGKWGGFVSYGAAYDVIYEHNVAVGNDGPGFLVSTSGHAEGIDWGGPLPSNTFTFRNNIAHNNTEDGALVVEGRDEWEVISQNNDWSVPSSVEYAVINMQQAFTPAQINAGVFGTGDLSADPVLTDGDASPPDVHLQTGSLCIDAGVDVGQPFDGAAPDMGRYEFTTRMWEPAGYAAGGLFTAIAVDPVEPNIVYLCSDVSGVYRSEDDGDTWQPKSKGLGSLAIASFLIDPSDHERLWAATAIGLYRSDDRGENWTLVNADISCFVLTNFQGIAVSNDGRTILVAAHQLAANEDFGNEYRGATLRGVLHRSDDGGTTWSAVSGLPQSYPEGTRFPSVVFDPHTVGQAFLAVSGHGILRSTDNGVSWSDFSTGFPGDLGDHAWRYLAVGPTTIYASATTLSNFSEATPARFYKSSTSAAAWSPIISGLPPEDTLSVGQMADVIRVSPEDESHVFLGYGGWPALFYKSVDGGASWSGVEVERDSTYFFDDVNAPFQVWMNPYYDLISLAIDPSNENRIYATSWSTVWRSENAGETWQEKVVGTQNTVCTDMLFAGETMFSAHMDTIVYRADDPTGPWQASLPQAGGATDIAHAWSLELGGDGALYAGVSVVGGAPRVYRSDDVGQSWVEVSPPFVSSGDSYVDAFTEVNLAADPNNPETIYVVNTLNTGGIYRSNDSGDSWTKLASQPASGQNLELIWFECLEVEPADSDRLYAGTYWDGLWYSTDTGESWSLAAGTGIDLSWKLVNEIVAVGDGAVWAACDDGVYRSTDYGQTFTRTLGNSVSFGGSDTEYVTSIVVNPDDKNEIFAGTAKQYPVYYNEGSVWHSSDGGDSWTEITGDLSFKRVSALLYKDGYLYAATNGANVYRVRVH